MACNRCRGGGNVLATETAELPDPLAYAQVWEEAARRSVVQPPCSRDQRSNARVSKPAQRDAGERKLRQAPYAAQEAAVLEIEPGRVGYESHTES